MSDRVHQKKLDPETIERGRHNIAAIRAQLKSTGEHRRPEPAPLVVERLAEPGVVALGERSDLTTDQVLLELAAADKRDDMQRTIERLEARVAHLEATLSMVMRTAADGIGDPTRPPP